ncbi:hypothetical protein I7I53_04920 [Histoplasma capsulatum var. duboisii H88]|uniref:Uncharacterized protein n=1 Tax=Ajellomyces capsulatus (strain H88) TaxID=544711 RepID=A0A8A1LRI3_AJEC8|nr:hypothetical protein I7I53_04920 [Histoplasma capsulatum var. duboisii H88]
MATPQKKASMLRISFAFIIAIHLPRFVPSTARGQRINQVWWTLSCLQSTEALGPCLVSFFLRVTFKDSLNKSRNPLNEDLNWIFLRIQ